MERAPDTTDVTIDATTDVTQRLADYASGLTLKDIPEDVRAIAKQCLLDWLGVTLAGAQEPLTQKLLDYARAEGCGDHATLIGLDGRGSVSQAALINGSAGHALDYDDVLKLLRGHPTAPVAPVALAFAERDLSSGADLLVAFIAGVENRSQDRWVRRRFPVHEGLAPDGNRRHVRRSRRRRAHHGPRWRRHGGGRLASQGPRRPASKPCSAPCANPCMQVKRPQMASSPRSWRNGNSRAGPTYSNARKASPRRKRRTSIRRPPWKDWAPISASRNFSSNIMRRATARMRVSNPPGQSPETPPSTSTRSSEWTSTCRSAR